MSSEVVGNNVCRYRFNRLDYGDRASRFCLRGLLGAELSEEMEGKRVALLEGLADFHPDTMRVLECSMGGCEVTVAEDTVNGRTRQGSCIAAAYCLKQAFEESGNKKLPPEHRRQLYREIMDTTEGFSGTGSAGNFCPRTDCGLSAGFSIDGVPGTAGECVAELKAPQQQLFPTT